MALNDHVRGYVRLQVDGESLTGDVTLGSIAGIDLSVDHVEVLSLHVGVMVDDDIGRRRGRPRRLPVRWTKPLDRATPLLVRVAAEGVEVDAAFLLFDADPTTGATRHRFTIRLTGARVTLVTSELLDTLDPDSSPRPGTDHVEMVASTIAWIDEVNGVEYGVRDDQV